MLRAFIRSSRHRASIIFLQEKVRAVARQLNLQARPEIALPAEPPAAPSSSKPEPNTHYRELGLVLATASPTTSLALILGQEPILAAEGFRVVLVIAPADPESARRQIIDLVQSGTAGILCCPSVYTSVSAIAAGTCPVIALSPWAAESLLKTLGVSRPPVQPTPIIVTSPKPEPLNPPPATAASTPIPPAGARSC